MINIKLFRYKRFKQMDGVRVKTLGRATLFLFNLVDKETKGDSNFGQRCN